MKNSHLVAIIKTFDKKEIRELRKWLKSPVHNQREDILHLLDYLVAGNHLSNEKYLEKERIYSKIFPLDKCYDDAKMRQVIHFLLKAVEEFLIYQELQKDKVGMRMTLSTVYRKRKLDKAFQKVFKQVQELNERTPFRNEHFFRNEYLIQQEQYAFFTEQIKKRNLPTNLQEVSDALDITYFVDKLKQSCLMLSHQAVFKVEYTAGLLEEVLAYVEENDFFDTPAIATYYFIYKAITNKAEPKYFEELKWHIEHSSQLFPQAEIRDIYLLAINYCIGKMNAGEKVFIREAFELYRRGIENEIIIENGRMSRWTFLNVVSIGLKLKEYEWIENFISEGQIYIHEQYRDNFYSFSQARLFFEKREYDNARMFLVNKDYTDILLNLSAKSLLLKIFYEEAEFDLLDSLLESTRIYLQRKKVMGYHKGNFQNVIYYTKKLVRTNPYKKEEVKVLKEEVNQAKPLAEGERTWLLEQIEAL